MDNDDRNAKYQEYRARRGKELQQWQHWHDQGRKPEHLEPLLKSIDPLVRSEARKRMSGLGGSIPSGALHNELRNAALRGIQSFDPARGVQLSTHIGNQFQRTSDFIAANRNAKYMPREDVDKYQELQNAKQELHLELGREPTPLEIQSRLGWGLKTIQKRLRGIGSEVFTDMGSDFENPEAKIHLHDAYQLVKSQMKPDEQRFAELHFPAEGKPANIKQIAKQLGVSEHRVYRLKARVETHLSKVMKNE